MTIAQLQPKLAINIYAISKVYVKQSITRISPHEVYAELRENPQSAGVSAGTGVRRSVLRSRCMWGPRAQEAGITLLEAAADRGGAAEGRCGSATVVIGMLTRKGEVDVTRRLHRDDGAFPVSAQGRCFYASRISFSSVSLSSKS